MAQRELPQTEQVECPVNCTPSELSTFLQALAEGYLATCSLDTDQSAPSRLNHIASKSYQRGRKTVSFPGFQFTMTLQRSTESLGAALLTWYREASLARTSAQPEKAQASPGSEAACGKKWRGSLARYDRDTSLWRTAQYSLLGDLELFSETWPRWGTMRNGECMGRETSEIATKGNAFGFSLTTPTASDGKRANLSSPCWQRRKNGGQRLSHGTLPEQLAWMGLRGTLRPILAEQMMCFPRGWTDLRPQEMPSTAEWYALHGIPFMNESNTKTPRP